MTDALHSDALAPGYRMHWYTVERVLGQGGFGITYLARDNNLDQRVAIKEYLPIEVASRRPDSTVHSRGEGTGERFRWGLDRFLQEARTLARFDHPNIVRVYSVYEFNGTAYMVMRFEEGENLGAQLERRGNLPEKDLLRILMPILDGLELVHGAGFIHRDIKPDNIHIRNDGSPVLLDFGSARHAVGKARTLTILVAPGYAPFEQYYSSSDNQGPWTDIYGLGATCYRAITGAPPLDAITRSKGMLGSTSDVMVPVRTIGGGRYSGQLLAAIDHALEFAEKDRPQTIAAWRAELIGAPNPVVPAPPSSVQAIAAAAASLESATPLPSTTAPQPASRWSVLRGPLLGAILGAVVAAAALVVWTPPREDQRIADIERRLDLQRVKEEQEKKAAQARMDELKAQAAERQIAEELERKRIESEKQSEPIPKVAVAPPPQIMKPKAAPTPKAVPRKQVSTQQSHPVVRSKQPVIRNAEPPMPEKREVEVITVPTPATKPAPLEPVASLARSSVQPPPAEVRPPPVAPAPSAEDSPAQPVAAVASAKVKLAQPVAPVPSDDAGALDYYRQLASQGNADAALKLGEMYEAGRGVIQSNNWAYSWYLVAEKRGMTAAKPLKDAVAAKLQPRERQQAEHFAERQARQLK